MTPGKNKEKDMKKILLSFLAVFLIGALVISCDSNARTISDETATVSFATSMGRALTTSIEYMDFGELDWYYKAVPSSSNKFTHGATPENEWVVLESGLSEQIELSQGFWTFYLQARMQDDSADVVFEGDKSGVLIKKQDTPVLVAINVSPSEDGKGSIVFSNIKIQGIEEDEEYFANSAVIGDGEKFAIGVTDVTKTLDAGDYNVVVSYEENGIVYGSETKRITVYSGATLTISGFLSEESQSAEFKPSLSVPSITFAKALDVINFDSDLNTAEVSEDKTIENSDLTIKYPQGITITGANAVSSGSGTYKADAETGFEYVGSSLSQESQNKNISIISGYESVAQFDLTLNVDTGNRVYLVEISKYIGEGIEILNVYHDGVVIASEEGTSTTQEYYSYDPSTGYITLYLFHASSIDIVSKVKELPLDAVVVVDVPSLRTALNDGAPYIALGNDIDLTNWGQSDSATAILNGEPAIFDLNGFTIKGEICSGDVLCTADETNITFVDSSEAKTGKIISKYSKCPEGEKTHLDGTTCRGYEMLQATALNAWQHAITINGGTYLSNNVAINCQVQNTSRPEGIIINDGYFGGTSENTYRYDIPAGGCVSAVIGTVTINGGTFTAAKYGSVIMAESGSSDVDTVVNIYGGTFKGACMFDFYEGSSKAIVNVYGGDFTVENPDGSGTVTPSGFACDNVTHAALVNNDDFELNIMGGTFNYDPSAYVDAEKYTVANNNGTWTVSKKTSSN